jgi:HlyD family secretion protein
MPWRQHLPKLLLAAIVLLLLFFVFRPRPLLVDTEAVSRGPMAQTIEEEGRTRVMERFVISAPLTAHSRRITLEPGDAVQAGELLVVLDAPAAPVLDVRSIAQAQAQVDAAQASLESARREAEAAGSAARLAAADLQRLQQLAAEEWISPREVQAAETEASRAQALQRSAESRVRTARHQLEAARAVLSFAGDADPTASGQLELRAPVAGEVLRRYFQSARLVQPGEPILEIGNPAALEVEIDVLSSDAVRLRPGMRVLFERWGNAEALDGVVRRIEPAGFTKISALGVEEQRVWVIADFTAPAEQWLRLGDGYRVNARFILWELDDVLRVPSSALFRRNDGWAAFAVRNGRAHLLPVEAGERGGRFTRVVAGLSEGAEVIVHPGGELEHGSRIRTRAGLP